MYNSFTKELLLLTYDEFNTINTYNQNEKNIKLFKYLVEHWFFIPDDINDNSIFYLFDRVYTASHKNSTFGPFRNITILTTTKCNARCDYCYEFQIIKRDMSTKTAIDVANYIKGHCENNVKLNWFGGEPLYNAKVIDIICNELKRNNVKYFSTITSNGYLFDQYNITSMKSLWNLKRVQITLDGTKDFYNKTKNYIYKNISAFDKVINNIQLLLDNDIYINIRLNLSLTNYDNLIELLNFLCNQFSSYKNIFVYSCPLYENTGCNSINYNNIDREHLYEQYINIEKYIRKLGFGKIFKIPNPISSHCMADNMQSVVITPEGNLTLCEHHIDDEFIGNIHDNILDQYIMDNWKEREEIEECKTCFFRPQCIKLKKCPAESKCSKGEIKYKEYLMEEIMKKSYENYKN